MIARYSLPAFVELWSDRSRYAIWLEVELCACEAMEEAGLVPVGTAARIRSLGLQPDPDAIQQIEQSTRHDVVAFLTHLEQLAGEPARWLHHGMTSSDVLDTAFAVQLVRATDLLLGSLERLIQALARRAREHMKTPIIGRSHGMHAEPLTFGVVLAGHLAETKRSRGRLQTARQEIAVGKLAGAVGTYGYLSPEIEARALSRLGLQPETVATQVVARDRHAYFFATLGVVASGLERLALNLRHWQRTEVGEAEEPFVAGQTGSSAMPHKRNPVLSENLCGLSRVVRAAVIPALENVALWHERDISHSSVERLIAPDATSTLGFMLERAVGLVEGLIVHRDRMRSNLELTAGLFHSEDVLLALVGKGLARQQAYRIVQRNAMRAGAGEGKFRELLENDPEVSTRLSPAELDQCFSLERRLAWAEHLVNRALEA